MSKNQLIEPIQEEVKEKTVKKTKTPKEKSSKKSSPIFRGLGEGIDAIRTGSIFTHKRVIQALPLILFITALFIIYIWNSYMADKKIREISKIKKELKEYRSEHITTRAEVMFSTKQSEIARRLDSTGIKESVVPPQKIFIKE